MADEPAAAAPPLAPLLLLLSVTTGLVDAVSVLGLGKVFTANMTGNVVFLGFAIAGAPGFRPEPLAAALASFLIGAFLAGRAGKELRPRPLRQWVLAAAVFETAMLWGAGALALNYEVADLAPRSHLFLIIALTGLAMGFRNATIRQLKVPDLTTTVLTLTLTGLAADSALAGGRNENWARRVLAVGAILLGATGGAFMVMHSGLALPLFLTGGLILGGTLIFASHPSSRAPHHA